MSLWSGSATELPGERVSSSKQGGPQSNQEHSWDGITLFRIDKPCKIIALVGGEIVPGPPNRSTRSVLQR